jgi:hypothetical protein
MKKFLKKCGDLQFSYFTVYGAMFFLLAWPLKTLRKGVAIKPILDLLVICPIPLLIAWFFDSIYIQFFCFPRIFIYISFDSNVNIFNPQHWRHFGRIILTTSVWCIVLIRTFLSNISMVNTRQIDLEEMIFSQIILFR